VKWQSFFDFSESQEEVYPPFGVKVKNDRDPIVSLEDNTPGMVKLNRIIVIDDSS
jgi:hypothetical protein